MTWAPAKNVLVPRALADNLLEFAIDKSTQEAALSWAGNANLKIIKGFARSVADRLVPIYPAVAFLQDDDAQDLTSDINTTVYTGTFEFRIQNSDPDVAVVNARIYAKAFMSLFANCPSVTLLAGTGATSGVLNTLKTQFNEIRANDALNDFLIEFHIQVQYVLHVAAFA